jgi:hypothetical protein
MKIVWNNALERGTASSVIAKGSPDYALEIGLRWEINYGDGYNWIKKHQILLLICPCCTGKSHLACTLATIENTIQYPDRY